MNKNSGINKKDDKQTLMRTMPTLDKPSNGNKPVNQAMPNPVYFPQNGTFIYQLFICHKGPPYDK